MAVLGTLDRSPPPIFRQGYSALTKLIFFSALALFLMVADSRFKIVQPVRAAIAAALSPAQRALLVPVNAARDSSEYLRGLHDAKQNEEAAKTALAAQALRAAQAEQLKQENEHLRGLLELRPSLTVKTVSAEVLYEAGDPFSRKVFIDRGTTHGVIQGSPVMTEHGLAGQVTRAYPISAEVTLVVDKNAAIPVLNVRTQQRLAAYGGTGDDLPMELRFVSATTDVQAGDKLETSGLDGVYPAGLPVATVKSVTPNSAGGFTRVVLDPAAMLDRLKHVLVLEPVTAQLPPRPAPEPEAPARAVKKKTKDAAAKEAKVEPKVEAKSAEAAAPAAPSASGARP